jgi:hypothetical protein
MFAITCRAGMRLLMVTAIVLPLLTPLSGGRAQDSASAQAPTQFDIRRALSPSPPRKGAQHGQSARGTNEGSGGEESALSEGILGLIRASDATAEQRMSRATRDLISMITQPWRGTLLLRDIRYWYIGRGFDAVIAQDGRLFMRDRDGFVLTPVAAMSVGELGGLPVAPDKDADGAIRVGGELAPGVGIGFSDPGATLARAMGKEDRYASERRDFLRATAPLRAHLEEKSNRALQRQRDLRITSTLEHIWKSGSERQRSMSETAVLWESLADDASGDRARALVIDFVDGWTLRQGSCPFTPSELLYFKERLTNQHPFVPCKPSSRPTNLNTGGEE